MQETAAAEKGKEPGAPKPNKTPFNFFSIGARARAKEAFPELGQIDITKKACTDALLMPLFGHQCADLCQAVASLH